jgi:hypothetical protein
MYLSTFWALPIATNFVHCQINFKTTFQVQPKKTTINICWNKGKQRRTFFIYLFTLISANIYCRFVRLDLKSCFEVHLAMYEVGWYWQRSERWKIHMLMVTIVSDSTLVLQTPTLHYSGEMHILSFFYTQMTFKRLLTTGEKNRSLIPKLHSWASFMTHIFYYWADD